MNCYRMCKYCGSHNVLPSSRRFHVSVTLYCYDCGDVTTVFYDDYDKSLNVMLPNIEQNDLAYDKFTNSRTAINTKTRKWSYRVDRILKKYGFR